MLIKTISSATVTSIIVYPEKMVLLKHFDFHISHFFKYLPVFTVFKIEKKKIFLNEGIYYVCHIYVSLEDLMWE